jgi:hypothetical protein
MKFRTTDFADRPSMDLFLFQNWISDQCQTSSIHVESGLDYTDIYDIKEKHAMHLPFLKARKSNREWNKDTIMVNPRRYGFPSRKTLCSL